MVRRSITFFLGLFAVAVLSAQSNFVTVKANQFNLDGKPYYYIGANYWYGGYLGLEKNKAKGIDRLRKELDFLKSNGVSNLRVLAGVEGSGQINGVQRVKPPLQPQKGVFDEKQLDGLDVFLDELGKRNMKAVLFLSNNWEWSGGFLQYLNWNGLVADSVMQRKLDWDELRDYTSKFYSCNECVDDYLKQVKLIVNRTNKVTNKKYSADPSIMAWELVNEPRPMRPAANEAYKAWINKTAAYIKSLDKNHLVTTGHEGIMATDGDTELYEQVHADKNIDYLTIHIWPKNWGWFKPETLEQDFASVRTKTVDYIDKHAVIARRLQKPLVLEEFGLPRDNHSFDIHATTDLRDDYYRSVFNEWQSDKETNDVISGINFWAYGGTAKPKQGQVYWKDGDDYMGDPPMEEQGLNSVFNSDTSTWKMIRNYTKNKVTNDASGYKLPADDVATRPTKNLYKNLQKLLNKGIMFGHQDDLAYGVGWKYVPGKSDVKEIVGDYPAVYGWELGNLELDKPVNLDSVPFSRMRGFIQQVYERGGVNTISWHFTNPVTMQNAWDTTHGGVQSIIPGGAKNELYKSWLDKLATFLLSLKGKNGEAIPVLLRPFHELTGNWFWWCKNTCTPAEFKFLCRYTIDYLRYQKGVHNVLFVYNTADFKTKQEFLERYPGDDVVDVVSFDAYQYGDPLKDNSFQQNLDRRLSIIEEVAKDKGKIAALAEAGYERIPYAEWWTNTLWNGIKNHKISYALVWRNAGLQANGNWHYYVPKKGEVSEQDFKKFYQLDKTLFQKDITKEKLYQ